MAETAPDTATSRRGAKDLESYRALLADVADFASPLGRAHGVDECVEGMRGLASITTDVVVQQTFGDETDVITRFDLHTADAPPCPVANRTRVANGKIIRIRATLDPRPLLPPSQ